MTVTELDRELPNGFHDAQVRTIAVDFVARIVTIGLDLWSGSMDQPRGGGRETYRAAMLELRGLGYVVMEPPDARSSGAAAKPVRIDLCEVAASNNLPPPQAGAFVSRFFVQDWNAFITVSALDASLNWNGEPIVRGPD